MSTIGPHVFGDDRLGCWIVSPANLASRLPALRATLASSLTDLFLPRTATSSDRVRVLNAGFRGCGLYEVARLEQTPEDFADQVLGDVARVGAGFADLNVELNGDLGLIENYCRRTVTRIRATRPNYRLRLNVAWRKGGGVPADLVIDDPQLFVAEQNYLEDMTPTSAADALDNLLAYGVPREKAAVCYGAGGPVGGHSGATRRVVTLGVGWRMRRGVVFQDDLLAEVGLL